MNTRAFRPADLIWIGLVAAFGCCAGTAFGAPGPASKLYVSDVSGDAQIDVGDRVHDLKKRSVYNAQGAVIDTSTPRDPKDRKKHFSTMVYSNGTGAFFDANTHVEIRRFTQQPFVPNRSDMDVEPSISDTQAFVAHGTVGLCASKLVAGSVMRYSTDLGAVNLHGGKTVIDAQPHETIIAMLEGNSTVQAGSHDMGGHELHAGEEAIIRPTAPGQPNRIEIVKIPKAVMSSFDDKVAMACMAKKTVYFEQRGVANSQESAAKGGAAKGEVTAFNSPDTTARTAGAPFKNAQGEIIALPVVPENLPVQYTISPAAIITAAGATSGTTSAPAPGG